MWSSEPQIVLLAETISTTSYFKLPKLVKRIYDILRMNVTIIVDDAPIYDEHAHEIDFESYSPTSKSIIFKTIAKEEKMKKLKEK